MNWEAIGAITDIVEGLSPDEEAEDKENDDGFNSTQAHQ
jgi:hypothetical protein